MIHVSVAFSCDAVPQCRRPPPPSGESGLRFLTICSSLIVYCAAEQQLAKQEAEWKSSDARRAGGEGGVPASRELMQALGCS